MYCQSGFQFFPHSEKLEIKDCEELVALSKGIQYLTSLTNLKIENCEQLE